MRTFLCLPVDEAISDRLAALSQKARERVSTRASWVAPENFHVTVRFLGEIDPMLTLELEAACKRVVREIPHFDLRIDRVGAFPAADRPRVLWAGGAAPDGFAALTERLEAALQSLGFGRSRPETVAHITLARLKGRPDRGIAETIAALSEIPDWTLSVGRLVLMESRLTPRGAVYTPLFSLPLRGGSGDGMV
jgi:RNA 2',3'-cyclic 3'-phosphodiesterase